MRIGSNSRKRYYSGGSLRKTDSRMMIRVSTKRDRVLRLKTADGLATALGCERKLCWGQAKEAWM